MEKNKTKPKQRSLKNKTKLTLLLSIGVFLAVVGMIFFWGILGTDWWQMVIGIVLLVGGTTLTIISIRFIDKAIRIKDMPKNIQTINLIAFIVGFIGIFIIGFSFANEKLNIFQLILGALFLGGGIFGVLYIQKYLKDKKDPFKEKEKAERKAAKAKAKEEKAKKEAEKKKAKKAEPKVAEAKKEEPKRVEPKKEEPKK